MKRGWGTYMIAELTMILATACGWFILIPFCLFQDWQMSPIPSINDGKRTIDEWKWMWLNRIYGNPEDGVSGQMALVWINGTTRVPYRPNTWPPLRAYLWSAWRNSADMLKYRLGWVTPSGQRGPYIKGTIQLFSKTFSYELGYKLENSIWMVPVFGFKLV